MGAPADAPTAVADLRHPAGRVVGRGRVAGERVRGVETDADREPVGGVAQRTHQGDPVLEVPTGRGLAAGGVLHQQRHGAAERPDALEPAVDRLLHGAVRPGLTGVHDEARRAARGRRRQLDPPRLPRPFTDGGRRRGRVDEVRRVHRGDSAGRRERSRVVAADRVAPLLRRREMELDELGTDPVGLGERP